jgi:phosphoglycolate phosphatase-like HAD superfamily hydrolase
MPDQKLIIWDFDGVLCDSLIECVTVATLAASRLQEPGLAVGEHNLHQICNPEKVMSLYQRLRPLRPFIVRGQDYLWQYFNLESFRETPADFTAYKRIAEPLFDAELDAAYDKAFYGARRQVQDIMRRQYFTLFRPYPRVLYAFRASLMRNRNYVCTARDQMGVSLLLGENAIAFPPERIFSKDFDGLVPNEGRSKTEQILTILDREGGRDQKFLVIEDQVKAPAELGASCPNMEVIHASYGYGLEHDWAAARVSAVRKVSRPEELVYNIY